MEVGELKLREAPISWGSEAQKAVGDSSIVAWESQRAANGDPSTARSRADDSARRLTKGVERSVSWAGQGPGSAENGTSIAPTPHAREGARPAAYDPAMLLSTAVAPPSEAGGANPLFTQASYPGGGIDATIDPLQTSPADLDFAAAEPYPQKPRAYSSSRHLHTASGNDFGSGGLSNGKSQWHTNPELARRRPLDDSALEADGVADTHALEKLWPLMAAVQRRQNTDSSLHRPLTPAFRLTTTQSAHARPPKLTRAQAEFLGNAHSRSAALATTGQRSLSAKHSGFFGRHNTQPMPLRSLGHDKFDSLRLLDPRKDRRMDPQERVRLWLEQGEPYFLSCAAPDWEKQNELPARTKPIQLQPQHPPKARRKPKPLERLFACFALF